MGLELWKLLTQPELYFRLALVNRDNRQGHADAIENGVPISAAVLWRSGRRGAAMLSSAEDSLFETAGSPVQHYAINLRMRTIKTTL